jgi:hypothetical protein
MTQGECLIAENSQQSAARLLRRLNLMPASEVEGTLTSAQLAQSVRTSKDIIAATTKES